MIAMTFTGGRFDGCTLGLAAPYTPERVYLVPAPKGTDADVLLVGTERMVPGPLFDDATEYRLDREHSDLRPHPRYPEMEEGEAVYRV